MLFAPFINYITDSYKTTLTSVGSVYVGSVIQPDTALTVADTALRHGAWVIAIISGALAIVNMFYPLRKIHENYIKRKKLKNTNK